jgi:dihydrodipicolinate synthase/N-acetylneuraminate lyase
MKRSVPDPGRAGARADTSQWPSWSGIFPSLCTPFREDGDIDVPAQREVARFALACRVHGIVCLGLAGEVTRLVPEERRRLSEAVIEEVNGAVPVLVGVGAEAAHTAAALASEAEAAGADGVVVPPPITAHAPAAALERYFLTVAGATSLPVMIQDAPAYLGVELSPQMVHRLAAAQPNVRYVKIESGPEGTARWVAELAPAGSLRVFTGDAGVHLLTTLRAGAAGNIPAVEIADLLVAAYEAERAGDRDGADALHARLLPYLVFALQTLDHSNLCGKEVLTRRGVLRRGGLRPPAPSMADPASQLLEGMLAALSREPAFIRDTSTGSRRTAG